ncbi:MAG TPA: hypothetical protein VGZ27_07550 [Vicinamibacterales bacterium]|nr:hypothetical protein [Vicinamibacterales bacterium]
MAMILAGGRPVMAQSAPPLDAGTALRDLIGEGQDLQSLLAPVVVNSITTEIASFPTASSSAGFSYTFDPQLGVPVLRTKSFGPLFVERPETTGRGRFGISLDFQRTHWRALDGFNLKRGDLQSNEAATGFSQTFVDLNTAIAVIGATAGVSDRVDLGATIPIVTASVSGSSSTFSGHFHSSLAGSSRGIGDVTLRSKVRVLDAGAFGLAAQVDARLPTGDAAKLLGVGRAEVRILLIAEERSDRVSHHLNAGYTFGGKGELPSDARLSSQTSLEPSDEINLSGGIDFAVGSKVTVSGDVIARGLRNAIKLTSPQGYYLSLEHRDVLMLLVGVAGVKLNVGGPWLLRANVLFPMTSNGLEPSITPTIGLERAF